MLDCRLAIRFAYISTGRDAILFITLLSFAFRTSSSGDGFLIRPSSTSTYRLFASRYLTWSTRIIALVPLSTIRPRASVTKISRILLRRHVA